ncbi:MAG: hypothetical protein IJH64_08515 [Oscillospiraceae bacterium]|nr:hypothetical protein [Oscillospiraceae bacterium]
MKNHLKVLLTVSAVFTVFLIVLFTTRRITVTKANEAYENYVSTHKVTDAYTDETEIPDYKIVDLNGDRIPELLFINRQDFTVEIWTFRGGKMYSLYNEGIGKASSFAYRKAEHKVAVIHMYPSGYSMQVYKVEKKRLKQTKTVLEYGDAYRMGFTEDESKRGTTLYFINNKEVSKNIFQKNWNDYIFTDSNWKMTAE